MTKGNILVIGSSNTDMTVKTRTLPRPGETVLGSHRPEDGRPGLHPLPERDRLKPVLSAAQEACYGQKKKATR